LQAVAPYTTAPVVRAVNGDAVLIKQLLDVGAQTLMMPMVESAEQARALVQAMRYPPHGIRGVGGGLTRATRWDAVPDYLNTAHEQLCLIVQVESRAGVENVEAIAAVDGVDAVFIGPADLSTGLGHAGNPSHPEVQNGFQHAVNATLAAGKVCGILAPNEDDARRYHELGLSVHRGGHRHQPAASGSEGKSRALSGRPGNDRALADVLIDRRNYRHLLS
jgi:4-hydroxy-2-oxoheptanedioate aldolase